MAPPLAFLDPQALTASLGLPVATLVYSFVSGFIPIFNNEVYLVGISAFASGPMLLLLGVMAGTGQMLAKSLIYGAGRGTLAFSLGRYEERREQMIERLEEREGSTGLFLFASAFVGFPPFYVISAAAGAVATAFPLFFAAGFAGRTLRFTLILATGSAALGWIL